MKIRTIVAVLILGLFSAAPSLADSIGIAVGSVGSTGQVGSTTQDPDGNSSTIDFFIPLTGDGTNPVTYGDTTGTSSDTCQIGTDCGGGLLEMILYFGSVDPGQAIISLLFTDLDLDGVNDPWYFFESLQVLDANGDELSASLVSGDNSSMQLIEVPVTVDGSGNTWISLIMGTNFTFPEHWIGYWLSNSAEHLGASIVSVPEPGTLALFGMGLLLMGFARKRRVG